MSRWPRGSILVLSIRGYTGDGWHIGKRQKSIFSGAVATTPWKLHRRTREDCFDTIAKMDVQVAWRSGELVVEQGMNAPSHGETIRTKEKRMRLKMPQMVNKKWLKNQDPDA